MAAGIPGSLFVEVPDAGHLAPLENPDVVNAALEQFL
jgi:pimeloyl-ACP methyl ester carboxylesterase